MNGRLYTESEVIELMQLVLKLNISCLQFSQSMKEIFEIVEALNEKKTIRGNAPQAVGMTKS